MSSHLFYFEQNKNIVTEFKLDQINKPDNAYKLRPFLPLDINFVPIDSGFEVIIKDSVNSKFPLLNQIGSFSSSFEIILLNPDNNKIQTSNKLYYTINTELQNFSLTFSIQNVQFNKFNIYLLYLPRLTSEISYSDEKKVINYKTLRCNDDCQIKVSSKKIYFRCNNQLPVKRIYVIKANGTNEIHFYDEENTQAVFREEIPKDFLRSNIHLGIFEIMYPSPTCQIDDLNAFKFNYSDVPSTNLYNVRYGYDRMSSSVIFEFFLKKDPIQKLHFGHIGVEIVTKYGRSFQSGYGHISTLHPIHVKFPPQELRKLVNFQGENLISICYSNKEISKPLEPFFQSQEGNFENFYKSLSNLFYELYIKRYDLFNDDAIKYFDKIFFDTSLITIKELDDYLFNEYKPDFQDENDENCKYLQIVAQNLGIFKKNVNQSFFIRKYDRSKNIQIRDIEKYNNYVGYRQIKTDGSVDTIKRFGSDASAFLLIKKNEDECSFDDFPFYSYYKERSEKLFYPTKFLPIHPFAVYPFSNNDFEYNIIDKNSFFVLENNECTCADDLQVYDKNDYTIDKKSILVSLVTSPFDDFTVNKIEAGRTYIKIKKKSNNTYCFLISLKRLRGFYGPVSVKKLDEPKEDGYFLKFDLESNITVHYSFNIKNNKKK